MALILRPDFIPCSDMEHPIYALHRCAHAFLVGDVALMNTHTHADKLTRLLGVAHDRNYLVTSLNQLARYVTSDEAGSSSHEIFHGSFSWDGFLLARFAPGRATSAKPSQMSMSEPN